MVKSWFVQALYVFRIGGCFHHPCYLVSCELYIQVLEGTGKYMVQWFGMLVCVAQGEEVQICVVCICIVWRIEVKQLEFMQLVFDWQICNLYKIVCTLQLEVGSRSVSLCSPYDFFSSICSPYDWQICILSLTWVYLSNPRLYKPNNLAPTLPSFHVGSSLAKDQEGVKVIALGIMAKRPIISCLFFFQYSFTIAHYEKTSGKTVETVNRFIELACFLYGQYGQNIMQK